MSMGIEKDNIIRDVAGEYRRRGAELQTIRETMAALLSGMEEEERRGWEGLLRRLGQQCMQLADISGALEEIYQNMVKATARAQEVPEGCAARAQEFGMSYFGNLEKKEHLLPIHYD